MGGAYSDVVVRLAARDRRQLAADFVALTKPRVVLMVLVTTLMGYDVALTGPADYLRMIHLLIGSLLAAGGTLAPNQYRERDLDARMDRTRARPLPAGRLQPLEAWLFGVALTLLGTAYLAALVNPLVALVTLATTILYLFAYTPLKRRTPLCTPAGRGMGGRTRRRRAGRVGAVRDPLFVAAASHTRHRAPLSRRLRACRRACAAGRRP